MIQNQQIDNIQEKFQNIKLVAFDVDGVLTDGSIIYTDNGEEIKSFNAKDGQGIALLSKNGFISAIITARQSSIVERRAQDLHITEVFQGSKNKFESLKILMEKHKVNLSEIAYVGDDLPDLCVLEKVGLAFCPNDAVEEVKQVCHFISSKDGGCGAVREITDLLIKTKAETLVNPVNYISF